MKKMHYQEFAAGIFGLRVLRLLASGLCCLAFASTGMAQTSRAVTLQLQCVGPQALNELMITLNNTGNTGTAVVIGTRLGNIYLANALSFEARLGNGRFLNFVYDNPTFSNNTMGREDPWIVPLPAHSSYTVTLSGNHFLSGSGERMDEVSGIADLQLRLTGREIEPLPLDMRGLVNWEVSATDMQAMVVAIPDDCR